MSPIQIQNIIVLIKQAIADMIGFYFVLFFCVFVFFFIQIFLNNGNELTKKGVDLSNARRLQNDEIILSLESNKIRELGINADFWAGFVFCVFFVLFHLQIAIGK